MSIVETFAEERRARLARIANRAVPQTVTLPPVVSKKYYKPTTPPAIIQDGVESLENEAAWSLAIMGLEDFTAPPKRLRIEEIQSVVALHYQMPRDDLLSQRRFKEILRARGVAIYLSRYLTLKSLPEIGRFFGGRDHATVLHSVRRVDERMQRDPEFADEVMFLWNKLKVRQ
jgi:hypothetical protein